MNPIAHSPKQPHSTGVFALIAAFLCIAGSGASAALPATAHAYATLEGPPLFSSAPGLPDGRVYEQVSPANKNGNQAGVTTLPQFGPASQHYGLASPDGNSVLFEGTGPMGESPAGNSDWFVASKNAGASGWSTRALMPTATFAGKQVETLETLPAYVFPSPDLSHAMVEATDWTLGPEPGTKCGSGVQLGEKQMFLTGPDPFLPATWLEQPTIADPVENCAPSDGEAGAPVGGTPDFSTVYFTYPGTLLPEDAERAAHTAGGEAETNAAAWGFYENREGVLHEAGTLPDNTWSPFGAVPAASGHGKASAGNEVSEDGSRAFFVSPDPGAVGSCETAEKGRGESSAQATAACAPQLYVRENGERTLLVSRDTLLPEAGGLPAVAPGGVLAMPNPTNNYVPDTASYVFASFDGSQAFFQSAEDLTKAASAASPGTEPKTYDFDVSTGVLTYLPNVAGEIVATDTDGSTLAFVRPEVGGAPAELDLWSAGPNGGSVTPVTQLPGSGAHVSEARMSSDGSVLVFTTASRLSGAFNSGGFEQIYRYDVPANALACVSCAPAGVTPSGDASISGLHSSETYEYNITNLRITGSVDERGISVDGGRIFFDSPDPLVPQDGDTNTYAIVGEGHINEKQGRDVYEWENGVVYLISGGQSARDTLLLDNSENGDDVFFATPESLVPGDTDGGYDVYDARIPHPGDNPPASAVPCEGAVCQGPPNVPSPLTPPASATFSGLGNPTPEVTPATTTKTTKKTVKCAKGKKLSHGKCVKVKSKKKQAKKANTKRGAKS